MFLKDVNRSDATGTSSPFTFAFPNGSSSVSTNPPLLLPPSFNFGTLAQTSFASTSDAGTKRSFSFDSDDETEHEAEPVGNKRFQPLVTGILPEERKRRTSEAEEPSGKRGGKYKFHHPLSVIPGELRFGHPCFWNHSSDSWDWGINKNAPYVSIVISNQESRDEGKRNYPSYYDHDIDDIVNLRSPVGTWQAEYSRLPSEGRFPSTIPLAVVIAGVHRGGIQVDFQGTIIYLAFVHAPQDFGYGNVNDCASDLEARIRLNLSINRITYEEIEIAKQQAQLFPQIIPVVKRTIAPDPLTSMEM